MIMWTFLMFSSLFNPLYQNTFSSKAEDTRAASSGTFIASSSATVLIGPVAGLLASICCGRYKAVLAGLWLTWCGYVITVPILILQWFLPDLHQTLSYSGFLIGVGISSIGFVLFFANSLLFGIDQMPYASGEQIVAFIHWYVWSGVVGVFASVLGKAAAKSINVESSYVAFNRVNAVTDAAVSCTVQQFSAGWMADN